MDFNPDKEAVDEAKVAVEGIIAHNPDSKTSQLIKDKLNKVAKLAVDLQHQYDEREKALEKSLEASEKFWPGLEELKHILKDVQDTLDAEELPAAEIEALNEQKAEHEVRCNEIMNLVNVITSFTPKEVPNARKNH